MTTILPHKAMEQAMLKKTQQFVRKVWYAGMYELRLSLPGHTWTSSHTMSGLFRSTVLSCHITGRNYTFLSFWRKEGYTIDYLTIVGFTGWFSEIGQWGYPFIHNYTCDKANAQSMIQDVIAEWPKEKKKQRALFKETDFIPEWIPLDLPDVIGKE